MNKVSIAMHQIIVRCCEKKALRYVPNITPIDSKHNLNTAKSTAVKCLAASTNLRIGLLIRSTL